MLPEWSPHLPPARGADDRAASNPVPGTRRSTSGGTLEAINTAGTSGLCPHPGRTPARTTHPTQGSPKGWVLELQRDGARLDQVPVASGAVLPRVRGNGFHPCHLPTLPRRMANHTRTDTGTRTVFKLEPNKKKKK